MMGASNGGWLIIKLGSVAPEMIGSAVLISSAGFRPINKKFVLQFMMPYLIKSPPEMARRFLELLSPPDFPPNPDTLELFELIMEHFHLERRSPPVIPNAEIRRLTAPTCLMMGQYEVTFNPYRVIERGLSLLPNAITAEIVPGVGHMMTHERPDLVITRVTSFLEKYAV
jgi:pimeloyl-ACP methyl ester carboxylesterase